MPFSNKKMNILLACIPTPNNRYLADLNDGLRAYANVVWDFEAFWKMENEYDIIHIHWPEYLSYEIEAYLHNTQSIPEDIWKKLKHCLKFWTEKSKLIYTRHNALPHARQDQEFQTLYRLVGSYAHTMVHFANYSIQQFREWYPEFTHIKHVVIPHHNYASLPNISTREEARKKLRIHPDAQVMLVFGDIKENEKPLIKEAFKAIPHGKKVLLAPGWKILRRKIAYIRLREWVWKFEQWLASKNKSFRINLGFVKEEDAHYYLNTADFLFIPRTNELNSGNITLGCTFGLVVVGKDTADIGEILKETGNPTFSVGDDASLKQAILQAYQLKESEHGEKNRVLAMNEWNMSKIADAYIKEMHQLINNAIA